MINDIMFTNEGNLAIVKGENKERYIDKLYKLTCNGLKEKEHLGLYEHVNNPKMYDNQYSIYNIDKEIFYRILRVKIKGIKYYTVIGIKQETEYKIKELYLINTNGDFIKEISAIEVVKALSINRNVSDIDELCMELIYEINTTNLMRISEDIIESNYAILKEPELFDFKKRGVVNDIR